MGFILMCHLPFTAPPSLSPLPTYPSAQSAQKSQHNMYKCTHSIIMSSFSPLSSLTYPHPSTQLWAHESNRTTCKCAILHSLTCLLHLTHSLTHSLTLPFAYLSGYKHAEEMVQYTQTFLCVMPFYPHPYPHSFPLPPTLHEACRGDSTIHTDGTIMHICAHCTLYFSSITYSDE